MLTPKKKFEFSIREERDREEFVSRLRSKTWNEGDVDWRFRLAMFLTFTPGISVVTHYNLARKWAGEIGRKGE